MKIFHCSHCSQLLFFENVVCMSCGRSLGYLPDKRVIASLDPAKSGEEGDWTSPLTGDTLRFCDNYRKYNVCNWLVRAEDARAGNGLCRACTLTRTIPDLAREGNDRLWYKLEVAKRRLVYTLDLLGLPLESRAEDPKGGLAFEFLDDPAPGSGEPRVMTGHSGGIITINVSEADDAERVRRRVALNEPYRTILGHFRHESGHYFWDRLIAGSPRHEPFRALFGDEREDYQAALRRHYQRPRQDWQSDYVSAYATMHPWEDWAETWAHYLHMTDALETAAACGMMLRPPRSGEPRLTQVPDPTAGREVAFERMMEGWRTITYVLNNLNRGLGNDDAYPFVLSPRSIEKLRFVHETVGNSGSEMA